MWCQASQERSALPSAGHRLDENLQNQRVAAQWHRVRCQHWTGCCPSRWIVLLWTVWRRVNMSFSLHIKHSRSIYHRLMSHLANVENKRHTFTRSGIIWHHKSHFEKTCVSDAFQCQKILKGCVICTSTYILNSFLTKYIYSSTASRYNFEVLTCFEGFHFLLIYTSTPLHFGGGFYIFTHVNMHDNFSCSSYFSQCTTLLNTLKAVA